MDETIESRWTDELGKSVIEKTVINQDVRTVCSQHFDGDSSGCSKCPINKQCHSIPTMNVTYESMDAWRCRLNRAASDAVLAAQQARGGD